MLSLTEFIDPQLKINGTLQVVGQFYALLRNPGEMEKTKEELHKNLQVFEDELKGKFFAGKIL